MKTPTTTTYKTADKQVNAVAPGDRFMIADSFIARVRFVSPYVEVGPVTLDCIPEDDSFSVADAGICMAVNFKLILDANYMLGIIQD